MLNIILIYKKGIYRRSGIYTRLVVKLSVYYIKSLSPFEKRRSTASSPVSTL